MESAIGNEKISPYWLKAPKPGAAIRHTAGKKKAPCCLVKMTKLGHNDEYNGYLVNIRLGRLSSGYFF